MRSQCGLNRIYFGSHFATKYINYPPPSPTVQQHTGRGGGQGYEESIRKKKKKKTQDRRAIPQARKINLFIFSLSFFVSKGYKLINAMRQKQEPRFGLLGVNSEGSSQCRCFIVCYCGFSINGHFHYGLTMKTITPVK